MQKHFKSPNNVASSARSETYFKLTKAEIPHRISIPKFIFKDKKRTDALTNFALSTFSEAQINRSDESENVFDIDLENITLDSEETIHDSEKFPIEAKTNFMTNQNNSFSLQSQDLLNHNISEGYLQCHQVLGAERELLKIESQAFDYVNNSHIVANNNFGNEENQCTHIYNHSFPAAIKISTVIKYQIH